MQILFCLNFDRNVEHFVIIHFLRGNLYLLCINEESIFHCSRDSFQRNSVKMVLQNKCIRNEVGAFCEYFPAKPPFTLNIFSDIITLLKESKLNNIVAFLFLINEQQLFMLFFYCGKRKSTYSMCSVQRVTKCK